MLPALPTALQVCHGGALPARTHTASHGGSRERERLVSPGSPDSLPLAAQDKPEFVRRRVRRLLAAGVVSVLSCMVKNESPALSNSCRELISR